MPELTVTCKNWDSNLIGNWEAASLITVEQAGQLMPSGGCEWATRVVELDDFADVTVTFALQLCQELGPAPATTYTVLKVVQSITVENDELVKIYGVCNGEHPDLADSIRCPAPIPWSRSPP